MDLSVGGDLHLQFGIGIFNLGASGSVGGKLHFVGVDFDLGSKVGVSNSGGEVAGNGFHKLGYGGGSCGVRGDF